MTSADRSTSPPAQGSISCAGGLLLLDILVHPDEPTTELRLTGELDCSTADDLRHHIAVAIDAHDPHRLLLDLSELAFIDSSGLSVMVRAHQLMARRGRLLSLCDPQPRVRRILHVAGLHTRLHITNGKAL
ncbi:MULTISPECIES: STAS domain-containing protein [Actinomadura]|uniref:Anti-sigma factor antagonist n=1 Tax=Actinomadura madurae TaxID=1993 RepID=A0A1I5YSI7_9ACTN|nr:STAS domain-containing protein [Actinomadura madurae]SFQ47176.1 anti-anti-sigma regulatory factor, SpoIIAA [Actinomadura madurae]SPT52078.1 Stage II sporulation protein AA [Actinomadura madurae]